MLFHVYDEPKPEGYYINEPDGIYRTVLDADWVLYILLPFLLILIVAGLMLAWRLHEIPKHRAEHKELRQAELVSALTLLGLFEHWVWAVALFIAYMDWSAIDDWALRLLQRARRIPADEGSLAAPSEAEQVNGVAAPPLLPSVVPDSEEKLP